MSSSSLFFEGPATEERLEYHHGQTHSYGRYEKHQRQQRRVPQRMQSSGNNQEHGSQRRLMQCRKYESRNDERNRYRFDDLDRRLPLEPLENHRAELQRKHRRVQHHTYGHLEHDRMRVAKDEGVPDAVGSPDIEHQARVNHQISQKRAQYRGGKDRFVFFQVEHVNHQRDRETAGGQSDAAKDVKADPESPGKFVVERR